MSDDLRERTPDEALGDDPAVRGTRSDIGATGNGVIGPAPGMQEVRDTNERTAREQAADPVRRSRPDEDGSDAGSGMDSGDAEPGRGAASDDETAWLRTASGDAGARQAR